MRSDFDAGKMLEERGWLLSVAGEADFARGMKIVNAINCSDKGLILSGTYGCGKTAFAKALFRGWSIFTMPDDRWILGRTQDALDLSRGDIILDDVGAEHAVYENFVKTESFADFIVRRYEAFMASVRKGYRPNRLVMTTNLNETEFIDRYGGRVVSRIKEMCLATHFTGKDKRTWEKVK